MLRPPHVVQRFEWQDQKEGSTNLIGVHAQERKSGFLRIGAALLVDARVPDS